VASGTIEHKKIPDIVIVHKGDLTLTGSYYNLNSYVPSGYALVSIMSYTSGAGFFGGADEFVYNIGTMTQITSGGTYDVWLTCAKT